MPLFYPEIYGHQTGPPIAYICIISSYPFSERIFAELVFVLSSSPKWVSSLSYRIKTQTKQQHFGHMHFRTDMYGLVLAFQNYIPFIFSTYCIIRFLIWLWIVINFWVTLQQIKRPLCRRPPSNPFFSLSYMFICICLPSVWSYLTTVCLLLYSSFRHGYLYPALCYSCSGRFLHN